MPLHSTVVLLLSTSLFVVARDSRGESKVIAVARADGDEETAVRWRADSHTSNGQRAVRRAIKEAGAWPHYEERPNSGVQWLVELQAPPDYARLQRTSVSSVDGGHGISISLNGGWGEHWLTVKSVEDQKGRWSVDGDAGMLEKLGTPLTSAQLDELRKIDAEADDATLLPLWRIVEADPTDLRAASEFAIAVFDSFAARNERVIAARDATFTAEQRSAIAKLDRVIFSGGGTDSAGARVRNGDGTYTQEPPGYEFVQGCALQDEQAFAVVGENADLSILVGSYVSDWLDCPRPKSESELDRAVVQWFAPAASIDKASFKARAEATQKCLSTLLTKEQRFKKINVSFVSDNMENGLIELLSAAELRPLVRNGQLAVEPIR